MHFPCPIALPRSSRHLLVTRSPVFSSSPSPSKWGTIFPETTAIYSSFSRVWPVRPVWVCRCLASRTSLRTLHSCVAVWCAHVAPRASQEDELGQLYLTNVDFLKNGVPASIIATMVRCVHRCNVGGADKRRSGRFFRRVLAYADDRVSNALPWVISLLTISIDFDVLGHECGANNRCLEIKRVSCG